jgi:hypothetical protein
LRRCCGVSPARAIVIKIIVIKVVAIMAVKMSFTMTFPLNLPANPFDEVQPYQSYIDLADPRATSSRARLRGILGDAKGRKIQSWIDCTKAVLALDTKNKYAGDLEGHVPMTDAGNLRSPHKRRADDTASMLTARVAIDRANRRVLISIVDHDVTLDLLLRIADENITDFDIALVNGRILGACGSAQQHRQ